MTYLKRTFRLRTSVYCYRIIEAYSANGAELRKSYIYIYGMQQYQYSCGQLYPLLCVRCSVPAFNNLALVLQKYKP